MCLWRGVQYQESTMERKGEEGLPMTSTLDVSELDFGAVSPMRGMGAYEWPWSQDSSRVKPSFKAVAELFSQNPTEPQNEGNSRVPHTAVARLHMTKARGWH